MNKILLAIQFWKGDREQASRVMRYIADLQQDHSNRADVLFFARFDTPQDRDTINYVSRKFNVHVATCRRRASGWPHGCNELWFGAMDWVYTMQEAKKIPSYKAIFTFESDGAPTAPHWIEHFSNQWDEAPNMAIQGAYLLAPGPHINGNAFFSCDKKFLYWLTRRVSGVAPHGGWDYLLYREFQKWGTRQIPGLQSYWNTPTIGEDWFNQEVARGTMFIHGVKDNSLIELGRKKYHQ